MIDDEKGIMVVLLQKYDHYSSYIVNHWKVFPHTSYTFSGAVPYCILLLLVNCSVFKFMTQNNFYATEMAFYGGLIRALNVPIVKARTIHTKQI